MKKPWSDPSMTEVMSVAAALASPNCDGGSDGSGCNSAT